MRPVALEHVTLAVLAGGAGARMGRPKALLEIGGKPILEHLLDRLAWPGPTLLVTAPGRQRPPGAARFDREAADAVAGEGPLRGVYTAITHTATPALVLIAVDMPALEQSDLAWFAQELLARPAAAGVMGKRGGEVLEPLPCALRPSRMLGIVSDHLASGRRSLRGIAKDEDVAVVDAASLPERMWLNVNTPGEWERYLGELGR